MNGIAKRRRGAGGRFGAAKPSKHQTNGKHSTKTNGERKRNKNASTVDAITTTTTTSLCYDADADISDEERVSVGRRIKKWNIYC